MNKPSEGFVKHLKKRATILAFGVGTALISKFAYHQEVKQITNHQGEIIYQHSDPDTNRIIQYLAGREKFTYQERRDLAFSTYKARLICNAARNEDVVLPADFIYMNYDQVIDYLSSNTLKTRSQIEKEFELELFTMTNNIPEQYPETPDLYNQLWQLEELSGAPRIRWATENNLPLGERSIAHYSIPNTLYITPVFDKTDNPYDDFVAEAAHAIQFQKDTPDSYIKLFSTLIHTAARTSQSENPFTITAFNQAYGQEYKRPGSIEYEAHEQIEPALLEMYPAIATAATPPQPTYDLESIKITVNLLIKSYTSLP